MSSPPRVVVFGGVYLGPATDVLDNIQPPCTSADLDLSLALVPEDRQSHMSLERKLSHQIEMVAHMPVTNECLLMVSDNANHDVESAILSRSWSLRQFKKASKDNSRGDLMATSTSMIENQNGEHKLTSPTTSGNVLARAREQLTVTR